MSYASSSSRIQRSSKKVKVICGCGDICPLRVANTASNRGKKFYSCPNWRQADKCKFFRWADECDELEQYCESSVEDGGIVEILLENRELRKENSELVLKNRAMVIYKIGLIMTWIAIVVCFFIYLC